MKLWQNVVLYEALASIAFTLIYNIIHFQAFKPLFVFYLFIGGLVASLLFHYREGWNKTGLVGLAIVLLLAPIVYFSMSMPIMYTILTLLALLSLLAPVLQKNITVGEALLSSTVYALILAFLVSTIIGTVIVIDSILSYFIYSRGKSSSSESG